MKAIPVAFAAVCLLMIAVLARQFATRGGRGDTPGEGGPSDVTPHVQRVGSAGRGAHAADPAESTPSLSAQAGNNSPAAVVDKATTPRAVAHTPADRSRAEAPSPGRTLNARSRTAAERCESSPGPAADPDVRWAGEAHAANLQRRLAEIRSALREQPDHEPALREALTLARQEHLPRLEMEVLGRLVAREPDDTGLRYEYGVALMRLQHWSDALRQLHCVIELDPDRVPAQYNLAVAHQRLGHLSDALRTWNAVIEHVPDDLEARAHRGEALLDLHEWERALHDFQHILQHDPHATDARLNAALALSNLGRVEEALDIARTVLEQEPRSLIALNRCADLAATLWLRDRRNAHLRDAALGWIATSLEIHAAQPEVCALKKLLESDDSAP